ncbi:MAG: hypothetical protein ABF806_09040 [Bifidobacterium psychraerophilum]|uniref:hypothetical protein n=1 Tax=Bifidobacterium psychraerophilum TaxID=218140 RepID=UPI0039EB157A
MKIDITRVPKGILAANSLISAVAEQGDLAERHYLELKSTLNLSTKKDKEKIAKFILGAANRMPDVAANAFEGYAVMIIGVSKGAITGIPPVEMMEISKVVQQYVGATGPRWDILWVPINGSTNQVLVILVDPPSYGQGPFPCRASGESLSSGRIYIRADGATREANAEEIDSLLKRATIGNKVDVDLDVGITGEIASVDSDQSVVEAYIHAVSTKLLSALPAKKQEETTSDLDKVQESINLTSRPPSTAAALMAGMMEPEKRSKEEYLVSVKTWEQEFRSAWDLALPKIAASQLTPITVKVINLTTTFFRDVEIDIHLEGSISGLDSIDAEETDSLHDLDLPEPPRKWGPKQRSLFSGLYEPIAPIAPADFGSYISNTIIYKNTGSVSIHLDVGSLRPQGTYTSEDDELVLVVADPTITTIHGTWTMTALDHDDIYSGNIEIPVTEKHDLTQRVQKILGTGDTEVSEEKN